MHSVIEVSGPEEVYIIDLGSASGTVVNGQRVNKARLESGDQLQFGNTIVVVEVGAESRQQAEPAGAGRRARIPRAGSAAPAAYAAPQAAAAEPVRRRRRSRRRTRTQRLAPQQGQPQQALRAAAGYAQQG